MQITTSRVAKCVNTNPLKNEKQTTKQASLKNKIKKVS